MIHEGNKRFRDAIELYIDHYIYATTKNERAIIIQKIIDSIINHGGSFKKKTGYPPRYITLSLQQCREKVGHALRDTAKVICRKRGIVVFMENQYRLSNALI
jgi:hypothetical protein